MKFFVKSSMTILKSNTIQYKENIDNKPILTQIISGRSYSVKSILHLVIYCSSRWYSTGAPK